MPRKPKVEKHRGVYEKVKGSGIWWIRYTKDGKRITESIGRHGDAITIYGQRVMEIRTGVKLGLTLGRRGIKFGALARGFKFATLFYDKQHTAIKDPSEWFEVACEEAGIEDVTWHTLRHTFASRCVMAGIDLKTLQVLMGHKTIAMTARYAHLSPGHLKTALTKLDPRKESVRGAAA
jgi:integrase